MISTTAHFRLSCQQIAVVDATNETFVVACPGSGKTRALVSRFVRVASSQAPRCGVAALSFSNAAIHEIVDRCAELRLPQLTRFPNFVGTFDRFIARYLVLPFYHRIYPGSARLIDSWDTIGISVNLRGVRCEGVSLDALRCDDEGIWSLDKGKIPRSARSYVDQDTSSWLDNAKNRWKSLIRNGWITCADARRLAVQNIRDPERGPALSKALAARFNEVMVDEAQDSGPQEIEVLEWLRDAGVRLVVVCDPNQAIFEFREARPELLKALGSKLASSAPLSGNYRSSPSICSLTATLKSGGGTERRDVPLGKNRDVKHPVLLYTHATRKAATAGQAFADAAKALKIDVEDSVVVAHSRSYASRVAGSPLSRSTSEANLSKLARASASIRLEKPSQTSLFSAIRQVELILLNLLGIDTSQSTPERLCEEKEIDVRWLRRSAYEALISMPPFNENSVREWADAAKNTLSLLAPPASLNWAKKPGAIIRCPPKTASKAASSLVGGGKADSALLPWSTVHQAKGRQFEAVLMAIPASTSASDTDELLDAWESGFDSEAKRVVYVGASRARRLLALSIPHKYEERLLGLLNAGGAEIRHHRL